MPDSQRPLEDRIVDLYDEDGSLRVLVDGMRVLTTDPTGRDAMREFLGQDPDEWAARLNEHQEALWLIAEGTRQFAAHGWAPSGLTPTDGVRLALSALAASNSLDETERMLADAWNDGMLAGAIPLNRIQGFGRPSEEYNALFQKRGHLLFKAWQHHRNGAYEASVPIVYAQVEGLCFDVTSKPFFSRGSGAAQPVDSRTLAGLHEALPVARQWFSESVDRTVADGGGSRHGILHGRELAYDDRVISTKAFVLLFAVMEWAEPIAAELGEWFEAERAARHAGSDEVDEYGRRHDRREFSETTKALSRLAGNQTGWYRNRGRRYRPELLRISEPQFAQCGLPEDHGIEMLVTEDGRAWWAWRRTPPGLVFAVGANASVEGPAFPGDVPMEWRYEGEEPPSGPPGEDPAWGNNPHHMGPHW